MLPGCRARCFHRWCWRHSTNSTSAVIAATKELAEAVPVDRGAMVLDVGSGLGGPSRYLAATYGCHVTGIDLNSSFVEAARYLAERAGFVDQVAYECAEALALPYDNGRFDVAWTQHVAMNIQDRTRLYGEVYRCCAAADVLPFTMLSPALGTLCIFRCHGLVVPTRAF